MFINIQQDKLLDLLVKNNLINEEQLSEIKQTASVTKKSVEEILKVKNIVNTEELVRVKAQALNLPYQSLEHEKIIDKALNVIPIKVAENYKIICFAKDNKKIKVGITDPDNFKAIEAVDFLAKEEGLKVEYYLVSDQSFDNIFKQYKTLTKEISTALETRAEEEAEALTKIKQEEKKIDIDEVIKSAPVAKIVSVVIRHAVESKASDIHIEPLQKESRVRYRIDGVLHTLLILPKNVHSAIVARIKVLANLKLDETRIPQDGRIRLVVHDKAIDLRISILPLVGEEKVAMRILDVSGGAPGLEELGFSGIGLGIIKKNIKKTYGVFLITGPTGSGKSTTLFSILNIVNKEGVNISTLEDPVEYFIQGVNQSQVRPEVGFTFASGLRSLLRQDPDVIMVGEIRDNETAELAIHAGLTGHFVLSTLHTNDAIGAIPRLLDMKVEPFLLASTLNTVVAQRLARKICPHCKTGYKAPANVEADITRELKKNPVDLREHIKDFNINKFTLYKGAGCQYCANTGYSGRIAIAEVLDINNQIQEIIIDQKKVFKMEDIRNSQKFISIKQNGIIKVLQGLTTWEEILRVVYD